MRRRWALGEGDRDQVLKAALDRQKRHLLDSPACEVGEEGEAALVELFEGNSPLVIASPHDGAFIPGGARKRSTNRVATRDRGASSVALLLAIELDLVPHVLICNCSRSVVDVNRSLAEGCEGDPLALAVHRSYHELLDSALARARSHGPVLLMDFHTQAHFKASGVDEVELGYNVPAAALNAGPPLLDGDGEASMRCREGCSLRSMWRRKDCPLSQLLAGDMSLGHHLALAGVAAVPRPGVPFNPAPSTAPPRVLHRYFSGSRSETMQRLLLAAPGEVDIVQVELPVRVSSNAFHWAQLTAAMARAIQNWAAPQPAHGVHGDASLKSSSAHRH